MLHRGSDIWTRQSMGQGRANPQSDRHEQDQKQDVTRNAYRTRSKQVGCFQGGVVGEASDICLGLDCAGTWMPSCTAGLGLHRTFPETEIHSSRCLDAWPAREARSYFQIELIMQKKGVKQHPELSSACELLCPLAWNEVWVSGIISHIVRQ